MGSYYDKFQTDNNKYTKNRKDIFNPTFNNYQNKSEKEKENKTKFEKNYDNFVKWASFFRWWPDIFIDMITPSDSEFRLMPYQRFMLRVFFRYQYVFCTMSRGTAKSFIELLAQFLIDIMFPGVKNSLTAGGSKQQGADIAKEKSQELFRYLTVLSQEFPIQNLGKDYAEFETKSKSHLDVVGCHNNSRGGRRNRGTIEEAFDIDVQTLNEAILPLFNVKRRTPKGIEDPNEFDEQVWYVTTAGYADSDIYLKQMEILKKMIQGESYFCFGSDYELSLYHGLLKQSKLNAILNDPSYSPLSFAREYGSKWIKFSEKSFFKLDSLNSCRILKKCEIKPDFKSHPNDFYIISYDSARVGGTANDASVLMVFRCTERKDGSYIKNLIFIKSYEDKNKNNNDTSSIMHYKNQCIEIKRYVDLFQPRSLVIDAQGNSQGLVDYLTDTTEDIEYGKTYPPYAVVSINNEKQSIDYTNKRIVPILHLVKVAGASSGDKMTDMNNILKGHIESQNIRFLISENEAQQILSKDKKILSMDDEIDHLAPYFQTAATVQELMQLEVIVEGHNIKLKPSSNRQRKDRYSALIYGLWHIVRYYEDENKKNSEITEDDLYFFTAGF